MLATGLCQMAFFPRTNMIKGKGKFKNSVWTFGTKLFL